MKFPAIVFSRRALWVVRSNDILTRTTKVSVKNGVFSGAVVVDADANAQKILSAKIRSGYGPLFGYNIFLNRNVIVDLIPDGETFKMDLGEIKQKVIADFNSWSGWATRGDWPELKANVMRANSVFQVIEAIGE